eukprot:g414.t1
MSHKAHELHYGFFGLTALGAASAFKFNSIELMDVTEFTDDEWMNEFDRAASEGGFLNLDNIGKLLVSIYHGPAPDGLEETFMEKFSGNTDGRVSRDEFAFALREMKKATADLREGQNLGAEYTSASEFQERMRANKLLKAAPKECFHEPMTTSMGLGWEKVDYDQILSGINPKLSCAETKYADAMVKAGVYY